MKKHFVGLLFLLGTQAYAAEGRVLGYLGQALESARIYSAPNSKSRVYYTAKQ